MVSRATVNTASSTVREVDGSEAAERLLGSPAVSDRHGQLATRQEAVTRVSG